MYQEPKVSIMSAAAIGGFTGAFTDIIIALVVDRFDQWAKTRRWLEGKEDRRKNGEGK